MFNPAGRAGFLLPSSLALSGILKEGAMTSSSHIGERLAARVEDVCLNAWPALQEIHYDGWLIRLAGGQTRRVNSVNVLREGSLPVSDKIAYCEDVYRRNALQSYFRILSTATSELESALIARGYRAEDETRTLYADFSKHPPMLPEFPADLSVGAPDAEWLAAYGLFHSLSATESGRLERILGQVAVPGVFAVVRNEVGAIRSLAKGAVHDRIVCINMVATDASARRRGYSRACLSAILGWAKDDAGATGACVQVLSANEFAIPLYESLGFTHELYRYHYLTRAEG
jgi:N-acetylglutamate synthase